MDGLRIANRFRWMFLAALLVFNNAGLLAGRGSVAWANVLLLLGVALATWVSYQLAQGRVWGPREVVAIAAVEDLLITAGVGLTGGLDSPLFVLYYPSLAVVGLALPLPGSVAYASAVGAVYAALCLMAAGDTVAEPAYRFAVVAQRWLALYGLLGLSAWAIRRERVARSRADARVAGLQQMNDELRATLDRLAGAWQAVDLASEPSALARSVKAVAAELGDDCRQIEAAVADLSGRAMTADSRQDLAMHKSRQAAGTAHDLTMQAQPTAIALDQADQAMSRARAVVESWSLRAGEVARLSAAVRRVADQTNLLAFNANIEAIQVGERGRRFAVVADEVRVVGEQAIDMAREIDVLSTEMWEGTQQVLAAMGQLGELLGQASGLAGRALEVGERQHMDAEALRLAAEAAAVAARDNAQVAQALWDVVVAQDAALGRLQDSVRRLDGWALAVRDNQRTLDAILARRPDHPSGRPAQE